MKISGSIMAAEGDIFEYARKLQYANVDYLHLDIFQDGKGCSLKDLETFDESYLPLDVHLIFRSIDRHEIDMINKADVRFINIQYETLENKRDIFQLADAFNGYFGLAITSSTPLSVIDSYVDNISQVLFMCSEPGVSGAKFDEKNYGRIEELHSKYPALKLFADGGIDNEKARIMKNLGITVAVSGSYLCKDITKLSIASYHLKYSDRENINITRNMIKSSFLPQISKDTNFADTVNIMNKYRMGLVFVVDGKKLVGLVGDGDIRRAFICYGKDIFDKTAEEFMNTSPFYVDSSYTVEKLLELLENKRSGIYVVPIVEKGDLIGAVDLHIGIGAE